MTPDEIRRLYSIRHTLPAFQRQMIERAYSELEGTASVTWDTPDINAADSAAVEIKADPSLAMPLTAPPFPRPETIDLTTDTQIKANPNRLPPVDGSSQRRASTIDLTASDEGAQDDASRSPQSQRQQSAPDRPERDDWVARRTAELVRRGKPLTYRDAAMSPEVARAQAEAEYDDPRGWSRNPNSVESRSPQVRAAVRRQLEAEAAQRSADVRSSIGGGEQQFNAADFRRQRAEEAAAKEANAQRKWDEWTTGGSLDRMARYAPEAYNQRWEAAAEERRKQNAEERARRYTTNPETGEVVRNEAYIAQQNKAEKDRLRRLNPIANAVLRRELQQMGVPTEQFESNVANDSDTGSAVNDRNSKFNRPAALAAKSEAKNARFAAADQAVQRRAMLRQNPWEYMGRGDINDEQRRTAAFLLSNGRGATANDVAALDAKMLLEGIEQGARTNMRIQGGEAAVAAAAEQKRFERMQSAEAAADQFVSGRGYGGWWRGYNPMPESDHGALVQFLIGRYGLSEQEARGIASKYPVKPGRADATAPPGA